MLTVNIGEVSTEQAGENEEKGHDLPVELVTVELELLVYLEEGEEGDGEANKELDNLSG